MSALVLTFVFEKRSMDAAQFVRDCGEGGRRDGTLSLL